MLGSPQLGTIIGHGVDDPLYGRVCYGHVIEPPQRIPYLGELDVSLP